ncbi:MAG: DNA polymerase III subunit alpha [Limnochordia bacterium]|nr:DNA polymerase III subunit alpha [Limnochordia bacterium]
MPVSFVHLHNHTEYSLLDGCCRINELISSAQKMGMSAVAMTDHGTMYGAVRFYETAIASGIKPILGVEMYLTSGSMKDRIKDEPLYHLVLLAATNEGYSNLIKLVSLAHLDGFYYKPRLDKALLAKHASGLIALSACLAGEVPSHILQGNLAQAEVALKEYIDIFGKDNFFLEVQDHGLPEQAIVNPELVRMAKKVGVGVVATNDVHYLNQEDARVHDILLCVQTNKTVDAPDRLTFPNDRFYLRSPEEMHQLFAWCPEALENTRRIAERCNVTLDMGSIRLPRFEPPKGQSTPAYLRELALTGAKKRYPVVNEPISQRLEHELGIIEQMGYSAYFLIVADFVNFAKSQGILVGPGRGSAASSLVAYCLGITNIDPLEYNLVFERFLNPERVTMPDIDIDFADDRREEVIEYVKEKYGADKVAQIITFGTMAARAAIRDAGRAMGVAYGRVDSLAKAIEPGLSIAEAIEASDFLTKLYAEDQAARDLLDIAQRLEGLPRHASTHAAGVIIGDEKLANIVPLQRMNDGFVVTQYPMEDLEKLGLLKMDFLGLRNLTVIDRTVKLIKKHRQEDVDIDAIPLDCPRVYECLSQGDTAGVFQMESNLYKDLLRQIQPTTIHDLVAILALGRPGPMDRIKDFTLRKKKQQSVTYMHPVLEPILKDTYGIMIYQEQVMRIAVELAGYTPGQADLLRRGMGKKKPELIAQEQECFIQGAVSRGVEQSVAEAVFHEMEKFAGYGFNLSHSAAYARISYQTAYLKVHYPTEFMAACLSSVMGSTERIVGYVNSCERMGIAVLPPDINQSHIDFTPVDGGIRFGLGAVKNVGAKAALGIVRSRKKPFTSLLDFCKGVPSELCSRNAVESLIKAGAFDALGPSRSAMLAVLPDVMAMAERDKRQRESQQMSLFSVDVTDSLSYPDTPEFSYRQRLAMEKEVLGLYVSGHPLRPHLAKLSDFTSTIGELKDQPDGARITIIGIVNGIKRITTRTNQPMMFASIEDGSGEVEAVILPQLMPQATPLVTEYAQVVLTGKLEQREDQPPKLLVQHLAPLGEHLFFIEVDLGRLSDLAVSQCYQILKDHPGSTPVFLKLVKDGTKISSFLSEEMWVAPTKELTTGLEGIGCSVALTTSRL